MMVSPRERLIMLTCETKQYMLRILEDLRRRVPDPVKRSLRSQKAFDSSWRWLLANLQTGDPQMSGNGTLEPTLHHLTYSELLSELIAEGDSKQVVFPIFARWETEGQVYDKREALRRLLYQHPNPHIVNRRFAQLEMTERIECVDSFPWSVMMDLTSVCNVLCRFCKYEHHHVPSAFLPVEHVKQIEWFPYISSLNFSAGTAESIVHPHFIEIFDYVRDAFPHLSLQILTNGRALSEAKLEIFRDRLDHLYVSMNASNKEDYDRAIDKGSWDQFYGNMRKMKAILKDSKRPRIQANFVLMRWNVDRAVEYLEFAAEHGAHLVSFCHFYPHYIPDLHKGNDEVLGRKFGFSDSLYFDKTSYDAAYSKVMKRAGELGVSVQMPPPFHQESKIYFGNRWANQVPDDCAEPWAELFLLWGWKSRREEATICCGLASDIGAYFDRDEIKTIEGFRRLWNSPVIQAYRRTVNGNNVNPICALCRKVDRFDPEGIYPDQRDFFRFVNLPIPPHLEEGSSSVDTHISPIQIDR